MVGERRTPVVVVCGFLGSGKTTLIRALLNSGRLGETAIIVNEFGAVGIDHHLLRKTDDRTVLLQHGCVCCGLRADLADALRDLLRRRDRGEIEPFDRVLIETTGLADPAPIAQTLVADPVVRNHFRIERVIVTVDVAAGPDNLAAYAEAVRQVAAADTIVVTKQDLRPGEATHQLMTLLRDINPGAIMIRASWGQGDDDRLMVVTPQLADDVSRSQPTDLGPTGDHGPPALHLAGGRVTSHCIVLDHPLNWPMFGLWLTMLLHRHGDRVLRLKGLLNVGTAAGPLLLEGVQHVIHAPRHLPAWPDGDRRSRLVFIVRDLDPDQIEASLAAFQEAARRT